MLCGVESDSYFFFILLYLFAFGFDLLVFELELFFSFEVLLLELFLQAGVELIVGGKELEVLLTSWIGHEVSEYI